MRLRFSLLWIHFNAMHMHSIRCIMHIIIYALTYLGIQVHVKNTINNNAKQCHKISTYIIRKGMIKPVWILTWERRFSSAFKVKLSCCLITFHKKTVNICRTRFVHECFFTGYSQWTHFTNENNLAYFC